MNAWKLRRFCARQADELVEVERVRARKVRAAAARVPCTPATDVRPVGRPSTLAGCTVELTGDDARHGTGRPRRIVEDPDLHSFVGRKPRAAMQLGEREPNGAERRLDVEEDRAGFVARSPAAGASTSSRSHGTALNMPPASTNENSSSRQLELLRDGLRSGHEFLCAPIQDGGCDGVALVARVLHVGCERGDGGWFEILTVDGLEQLSGPRRRRNARARAA